MRVFNDRDACPAGAVVTEGVCPGVVQLSNEAWYDPVEPGTMGSLERHGNANVLTLDKGTSKLAQGPRALPALVDIESYDGKAPLISVFSPPPMIDPKASCATAQVAKFWASSNLGFGSKPGLCRHRQSGQLLGVKRKERVEKQTLPLEGRLSWVDRSYQWLGPDFAS